MQIPFIFDNITDAYYGNLQIDSLYFGNALIWSWINRLPFEVAFPAYSDLAAKLKLQNIEESEFRALLSGIFDISATMSQKASLIDIQTKFLSSMDANIQDIQVFGSNEFQCLFDAHPLVDLINGISCFHSCEFRTNFTGDSPAIILHKASISPPVKFKANIIADGNFSGKIEDFSSIEFSAKLEGSCNELVINASLTSKLEKINVPLIGISDFNAIINTLQPAKSKTVFDASTQLEAAVKLVRIRLWSQGNEPFSSFDDFNSLFYINLT